MSVIRKLNIYNVLSQLVAEEMTDFDEKGVYTFLSYYSISIAGETSVDYSRFSRIGIDGIGLVFVWKVLFGKKIERLSFDNTSVARHVLAEANNKGDCLSIIGSNKEYLFRFLDNIKKEYGSINVNVVSDGYFDSDGKKNLLRLLAEQSGGLVIIGMGTKFQDQFALDVWEINKNLRIFTCGGFIHQASDNLDYYPKLIDRLNLRVIYRMYKEKGTVKKFLKIIDIFLYPLWLKLRR